jgi:hypothetical protein
MQAGAALRVTTNFSYLGAATSTLHVWSDPSFAAASKAAGVVSMASRGGLMRVIQIIESAARCELPMPPPELRGSAMQMLPSFLNIQFMEESVARFLCAFVSLVVLWLACMGLMCCCRGHPCCCLRIFRKKARNVEVAKKNQ